MVCAFLPDNAPHSYKTAAHLDRRFQYKIAYLGIDKILQRNADFPYMLLRNHIDARFFHRLEGSRSTLSRDSNTLHRRAQQLIRTGLHRILEDIRSIGSL